MRPRRVLVFVEGVSDTRFFERVIAPLIRPAELKTVEYACMLKKDVNKRLRAERRIGNPLLFVADRDLTSDTCSSCRPTSKYLMLDSSCSPPTLAPCTRSQHASPCSGKGKAKNMQAHPALEEHQIIVVSREIESWYLAGISNDSARSLGLGQLSPRTDDLFKEDFKQLIPRRFRSTNDFMLEILNQFDVLLARTRNNSFDYLLRRIEALTA
jgi:hypothetical protein